LSAIIESLGEDSEKLSVSAQITKVNGFAVLPQNGMNRYEIVPSIERSARAGGAYGLAEIIDRRRNAVGIAVNRGQLLDVHRRQGKGFARMTGLNWIICGETDAPGQVESSSPFSAVPATMPKMLFWSATPLRPSSPALFRNLGNSTMEPSCHWKGTQVLPLWVRPSAIDPQKSSPFGSKVRVSACPTTCLQKFTP
jgi:hypothetical protein